MEAIFRRRSIRKYQTTPVDPAKIKQLLRAGMAAPSSGNNREWVFVVIQDRDTLHKIVEMDSYAGALKTAPLCIALCADMRCVSEPDEIFWIQDLSAAAQNMLLEATELHLGSLWMGLYPRQRAALRQLLHLPEYVEPLLLMAFGTAAEEKAPIDRYLPERVHFECYRPDTKASASEGPCKEL